MHAGAMGNADGTPSGGEGYFRASDGMKEEKHWLPDYKKIL